MLKRLIEFSLENRFLVIAVAALVAVAGIYSAIRLPIDAVPDMTNVQVTVITSAGSLPPVAVEKLVTSPIEAKMSGLPGVEELRSISKFGISVVTLVFEEGTDIYFARQVVAERLPDAAKAIPAGFDAPEIGPLSTALGEILQIEIRGGGIGPMELRSILERDVAPRLREVNGVTEINVHGGYFRTYEVRPDPESLLANNVTLDEIFEKIRANNGSAGGGYIIHNREQRFIRGEALLRSTAEIGEIVLRRTEQGNTLLLRDIAAISCEPMTRQGSVTRDGRGEAVTGMVMMRIGENSRVVVQRVKERLKELHEILPEGVALEIIYDRSALIGRTLNTVVRNLVEGGILVVAVLLVMLGSFRAGLIVALAIPLSMLFAANLMYGAAISASLMSLGAIDFGLIVDSSVIMVENCMHRLGGQADGRTRMQIIRDASIEVRKPTLFGELIIAVVFVPVLLLEGTEGKLFRPMALTVLFALFGSLILSMTLMPALASLMLPRTHVPKDILVIRLIKWIYRPMLKVALLRPALTLLVAIGVFVSSIPIAMNLGAEFMPRLNEGDLLIEAQRLPSSTIEDAPETGRQIETILREFPEVRTVFCKTGRPEIANDVMGVHQTDVWVMLKPRDQWRINVSRNDLIAEMDEKLSNQVPAVSFGFTQPIEMRVDELVAGVKSDVAVLLYGSELEVLAEKSKEIEGVLAGIAGAADVQADIQSNLQSLTILPRRDVLARYGIDVRQVLDVVESLGGKDCGDILDGPIRYPILVRIPEAWRKDTELLKRLPVARTGNLVVPLGEVADFSFDETPPAVEHDMARRRTFVAANVRGRDVASFVNEARKTVAERVQLPTGYEIRWGGDFENLQSASQRLILITPIVLLVIFLLLNATFRSVRLALLIFLAVPMAASGGILALAFRDMPFSISAGIGFIALFGVAVLNGLVWVSAAETLRNSGLSIRQVVDETAINRLRPILMTALVASLGFMPMALSTSDGAELQRPLATVVIGGLITSTMLTSFVIPALYPLFAIGLKTKASSLMELPAMQSAD